MIRVVRRAGAGLVLAALGSACGWHTGLAAPTGIRSVGLEVFGNDTPEPDLEPRLATRLADAVERLVDADLVRPGRADAVVRGKIRELRRRMGVRNENNQLLETGTLLVVEAQLVHRRTGNTLRQAEHRIWSDYVLGDREADGRAIDRAFEHLAERLVLDLFGPKAYEGTSEERDDSPTPGQQEFVDGAGSGTSDH